MEFLNPSFFIFLLLLVIPIIIHLFNFRQYQKIYFSSTFFLKNLKEQSKTIKNIRKWLILLNRLLILSSLVIAFSLPIIKNQQNNQKSDVISFYIDNSYSMSRIDNQNNDLLKNSKLNVKKIITSLEPSQKVLIITNDFEPKHQKLYFPHEAIAIIDSIKFSSKSLKLENIFRKNEQFADTMQNNSLYLFSDFQKGKSSQDLTLNKKYKIKIAILESNNNLNISIDSCYFKHPIRERNQLENMLVKITNHGPEDITSKATLFIDDAIKANYDIEIPAFSSVTEKMHYINPENKNFVNGYIEIEDSSMEFDNKLYFSYSLQNKIPVAAITDEKLSKYLENIFTDSIFILNTYKVHQIDYNQIAKNNLVVLDQLKKIPNEILPTLRDVLNNGNNILMFPNNESDIRNYNNILENLNGPKLTKWTNQKNEIGLINYNHPIFDNVFKQRTKKIIFPKVKYYFKLNNNFKNQYFEILQFLNGELFFGEYIYGKGSLYIGCSDLNIDNNNFAKNGLFIPIIYNTALIDNNLAKLYHFLEKETIIENNKINFDDQVKLVNHNNFYLIAQTLSSPQKTLINFGNNIEEAGNYDLILHDKFLEPISFNFQRNESKMQFNNLTEIKKLFEKTNYQILDLNQNQLSVDYSENNKNKNLAHIFIIISIILMIIELILLRRWN